MPAATGPTPIEIITSPFVRFAKREAAGGIVLLASTLLALAWANSSWQHSYHHLLSTELSIGFGEFTVTENRHEWINDGLMSLFFFLVGLEIKREILVGELSSVRRAALPFIAAVGGVVVPASIYIWLNGGTDLARGWAIPIATDIAFALGILTFAGSRVPTSLRVFVTALAIVDDILAVIIIAVFYTSEINYVSLATGLACVALSFVANIAGVRNPAVYAAIGFFAWMGVLNSGVHATIAGILLAFTIPARTFLDKSLFLEQGRSLLSQMEKAGADSHDELSIIYTLEKKMAMAQSPLLRIEYRLQPWIVFFVMPIFALANAGVNVADNVALAVRHPVSIAVTLGLVIGKPVGITLFSLLAIKTRITLPLSKVSWRQLLGASCLCGIGFTMSLFVAGLAFGEGQLREISKIGILIASFLSAVLGSILLSRRESA